MPRSASLQSCDHDVFQFLVQEFFGRFFAGRFHFDEIRQHAGRLESFGLPLLDGGEQPLHRLSVV